MPAELDYSKPLLYVTSLGDPWATADNVCPVELGWGGVVLGGSDLAFSARQVLGVLYKRTGDPMARRFAFHIMHL